MNRAASDRPTPHQRPPADARPVTPDAAVALKTDPLFPADEARFRAVVDQQLDFTWRSLRRLGLPPDVADDATQRVFLVVHRKLASIEPGRERAFLFNAAIRVASSEKRSFARRREVQADDEVEEVSDPRASVDERIDDQRARSLLDELLGELDMELRTVFVLYELEGMTTAEIGTTLGVPRGTAASRLRRAREAFRGALKRRQARNAKQPGRK